MAGQKLIVVGNGMTSHRLVSLLTQEGNQDWEISVFSEEPYLAYDRVGLSGFLAGKKVEDLMLADAAEYERLGVKVFSQDAVVAVDRFNRTVTSAQGRTASYDVLVFATGASVWVPPVKGKDLPGVSVYRTLKDVQAVAQRLVEAKTCVVIGGGLLGLEAADVLRRKGVQVSIVEAAPRLMPLQVDFVGGVFLEEKLRSLGFELFLGRPVKEITEKNGSVNSVVLGDGQVIPADMVVFSTGITPRDELARQSGVPCGERGGIIVDDECRTSDPNLFAIGDCALFQNNVFGLIGPGYAMAEVVAAQLSGAEDKKFVAPHLHTRLKMPGVDVVSFGDPFGTSPGAREVLWSDPVAGIYKKLVINRSGTRLLGGVLVGDLAEANTLLQVFHEQSELPAKPSTLIVPAGDAQKDGKAKGGVENLSDSAVVCSCSNVTKGQICAAIREKGLTEVAQIKKCTKAGTGCGGCVPLIGEILKAEMKRAGQKVARGVCEHFDFSRQEIYSLVRSEKIQSFDVLLSQHGRGLGCEICKPLVGSILASVWNDHVLTEENAPLQDTNDAFLGNIQKDGTYSVVPRIPGGEITPDKLMAIAQIAKEFDLYTKITGGQRIDLFGVKLELLPVIWERLVAAGFESGHAYGKSLRTVKSCVGSRWCRYGVQDSTSLAIEVELRYRGLRSPHKLKSAVSGCTRECAEAQSKDFGIIATEKGWNLYVCGNGGMKPQHAVLLASDLDKNTLIRYLDRFLMFYIRTADRLERTSTWFSKLEGGIEYLRDVIIKDSLGICAELEAEMAHVIATYRCEWKEVVDDPAKRKRFSESINGTQNSGETSAPWNDVCALDDILPNTGACVCVNGEHVAVFRVGRGEQFFALGNYDPAGRASVLSRGIIGDKNGRLKVASPLYKHNYCLQTGVCLDDESLKIPVFEVKVQDGRVWVGPRKTELDLRQGV